MEEQRQEQPPEEPGNGGTEAREEKDLAALLEDEKGKALTYLANWQRATADYQNLKRRGDEERAEVGRLATASLVFNLLPLQDDLERALRTVDTKLAGLTWIDGIWLIYRKFQASLENAGVKEIPADGQAFDPNVHEAISEAPGEDGKIVSVVQKGYKLGERVLRPAMVIVGKGEPKADKPSGEETNEGRGEERESGKEEPSTNQGATGQ